MSTKSANASEKSVENKAGMVQKTSTIGRALRKSAFVGAAVGLMVAASPLKAQLSTNTISLNQTTLSLDWQPEAATGQFGNVNGSQSYTVFDSSLGTLDSVTVLLSVNYNISDAQNSLTPAQWQDVISLSPILGSPFYNGSTYTSITTIGGNQAALPNAVFSYNQTGINRQSQSGTLDYTLTFSSPSQLNAFEQSDGTIIESLANGSTLAPDAPFQVGNVQGVSDIGVDETINGTISYAFAPESIPEPAAGKLIILALSGLGATRMLRGKRN